MMKNSILGLMLSFGTSAICVAQTSTQIEIRTEGVISNSPSEKIAVENAISEASISETLSFLSSDELEGRKAGTAGIEKAASYIEEVFKKNNVKPFFETYRDSFAIKELDAYNIVGYVEGTDPKLKDEFIVVGAHYDHIGSGKKVGDDSLANGANDNATGTTVVLELAKYFAAHPPKRSFLFTLFSAEEMGLLGSKELAARLKKDQIDLYLMFNIEMVGVPMTGRNYLGYLTGFEKSNLAEKFNAFAGEEVLGFLPEAAQYRLFMRSDNYAFFKEFGVPSHTVSTFDFTNYQYYHHVDDEFSEMDTAHMERFTESLVLPLMELANTPEKEIKMLEK
ncbi:M28 family peptidase [Salinimicrobium soli]|uniref:M28 family peptidase n=1 Tax=Salinimicrobium soli TaxID=1254399 RepID=UPI003AADD7FF